MTFNEKVVVLVTLVLLPGLSYTAGYIGVQNSINTVEINSSVTTHSHNKTVHHTKIINRTINPSQHEIEIDGSIADPIDPTTPENTATITGDTIHIQDLGSCGDVYGDSMNPLLPPGSTVCTTKYTGYHDLKRGMLVRYITDDDDPVLHQIHGVYPDYILVDGITDTAMRERINRSQVTGIITATTLPQP